MLRRNLIVSALSAALVRSKAAKAQAAAEDDFWLYGEDEDGPISDADEKLERLCATRVEFDGYRIQYSMSNRIVAATATFADAGFAVHYQASQDGTRDFVRSRGDAEVLRFRNVSISTAYFAPFAAAYFADGGVSVPLVLRADDLDAGTSAILKATLTTGDKRSAGNNGAVQHTVKLDDDSAEQRRFNRFLSGDGRIMLTLGCFVAQEERWRLIKRRVYSNPRLDRSLASSARTFAEGLQEINYAECRQRCFLTTACCEAYGKPDDCYELETLRAFRNGWLRFQPGGAAAIATYGVVAPKICAALARDPRRDRQLARIYWGTIVPCLALIRLGLRRPAYALYRRLVTRLMERYAIA